MAVNVAWTDADDLILTEARREGVGFTKIGIMLGRSKDSCISRAHRLRLPIIPRKLQRPLVCTTPKEPRQAPERPKAFVISTKAVPRFKTEPQPTSRPCDDKPGIPFELLSRGMCKWPMNKGGSCGEKAEGVYCGSHAARARR